MFRYFKRSKAIYKKCSVIIDKLLPIPQLTLCKFLNIIIGDNWLGKLAPCRFTGWEVRVRNDSLPLAHVAIAAAGCGWTDAWGGSQGSGVNTTTNIGIGKYMRLCATMTEAEVDRAKNLLKANTLLQLDGTIFICGDMHFLLRFWVAGYRNL
uniref:Uncharacterized protein n=1 Tax=Glossina austeni TaxID=7395 RepID=A0A1A9UN62_GLOAU